MSTVLVYELRARIHVYNPYLPLRRSNPSATSTRSSYHRSSLLEGVRCPARVLLGMLNDALQRSFIDYWGRHWLLSMDGWEGEGGCVGVGRLGRVCVEGMVGRGICYMGHCYYGVW